jgi:DNA-binding response OmpR family regulator
VNEPKILVVEDEAPIREGLVDRLEREGYRVVAAATRAEGLAALQGAPDLVILDRRLPDGEGLDVLRALRASGRPGAVIVLSARGMAQDRIAGLEDGADDYVTKPFHLRELLARVKAVLARAGREPGATTREIAFGDFVLDVGGRRLLRGRSEIALSRLEFGLLHYLATNPGRAIARTELLDRVWGYDRYPTTRTVDFHVLALRKKIERAGEPPRHIVTVQRIGYRFQP